MSNANINGAANATSTFFMQERQKFVVIVFPLGLQGKIWATVLRSQGISVIWESHDVSLPQTLTTLKRQDGLPDLLIVDTRLHNLQPYHLVRWTRDYCSELGVVLVNGAQTDIAPAERQWALLQGASDLLPRFKSASLVSSAVANLRKVLDLLNTMPLHQRSLVTALLKLGVGPRSQQATTPEPVDPVAPFL